MKSVRLTLQYGPETVHPMHRFVAGHDAFRSYRMVHWNNAPEDHNVLLFHVVGDREAYRERLTDLEGPIAVEFTDDGTTESRSPGTDGGRCSTGPSDRHGGEDADVESFYVYVREESGDLVDRQVTAFSRGSLVPIPPLEFRMDWSVRFRLIGEPEDIHTALECVPDGIETTIEQVSEYRGTDPATEEMTPRQREALAIARDLGYFAVPREADLEEVAAELECAPGTASQLLRRAQERVVGGLNL